MGELRNGFDRANDASRWGWSKAGGGDRTGKGV